MRRPNFTRESSFTGIVAGVDEAGCGPLAGPVVAAAVILSRKKRPTGMNDSKKLTPEQRETLYGKIMACAHTGIGIASVEEIDRINILRARLLAMQRAVESLLIVPEVALVDGNRAPALSCRIELIIDGDSQCMSIAAASIIAKVTRDRMMRELAAHYPGYGWEHNAGYGTPAHRTALTSLGVTPHHRKSFAPVREAMEKIAIRMTG